ncbi:MAG: hypothetical protein EB127_08260 [Alphaproteobacteria bacterium]|nr:hypothetical protein [Alphaproteobacteria bacterium]
MQDNKLGVWYQSGHKLVACYKAIEAFRLHYPTSKIDLYEDGSTDYDIIKDRFNVNLTRIPQSGLSFQTHGRPIHSLETNFIWLNRIYESCVGYLSDCDWILLYEDDVWCRRKIQIDPTMDLEGAGGPLWKPELYKFLLEYHNIPDTEDRSYWSSNGTFEGYGACGGTIFKRESFLKAYAGVKEIPWGKIKEIDDRPLEWSDASLTLVFQMANLKTGKWRDWAQYDSKGLGNWWDKTGWTIPMEEQADAAFLHAYKHYYNYPKEEIVNFI